MRLETAVTFRTTTGETTNLHEITCCYREHRTLTQTVKVLLACKTPVGRVRLGGRVERFTAKPCTGEIALKHTPLR